MEQKPFTILDWDTNHFGLTTARLLPGEASLSSAMEQLRRERVALAYLFAPDGDHRLYQQALASGGRHVDEKRTYVGSLAALSPDKTSEIRPYTSHELHPDLVSLALASGEYSRFSVDPRFPRERFEALYTEWMKASIERRLAEVVLIAAQGDRIVGVVTIGVKGGRADIGLLAVASTERGRGLGGQLVRAAARWGLSAGLTEGQVVTQGNNLGACRLYARCGYHLEKREHVFHFWI